MTAPIRHGTARPALIVDQWAKVLADPVSRTQVGRPGQTEPMAGIAILGRERVVSALPCGLGLPVQLERPRVIVDPWGMRLRDPQGNYIGDRAGIWVNRLLGGMAVHDTRRLG